MKDAQDEPQIYGYVVIGFDLGDPEGCQSIMNITTGQGRENDEELARLVIRTLRDSAGIISGECPKCFGGPLYRDSLDDDNFRDVAHCDVCESEIPGEIYRKIIGLE